MRFGIALPVEVPGASGTTMLEWMARVDDSPFDTLAVTDEIVSPSHEALTILAAAAAITRRPRLMSVVIAAPPRTTAHLAKQAATIDALSGGRLSLGLGVGELADDFAVAGVELRGRGDRFENQLQTMKRIWAGEPFGESGRAIGPSPERPGGPELLIGGWAPRALDRIGRYADGYVGAVISGEMISDVPIRIAERSWKENNRTGKPRYVNNVYFSLGPDAESTVRSYVHAAYAGSPEYDLQAIVDVTPSTTDGIRRMIERLEAVGVDELIFHSVTSDIDQFERMADIVA